MEVLGEVVGVFNVLKNVFGWVCFLEGLDDVNVVLLGVVLDVLVLVLMNGVIYMVDLMGG